jgi:YggT family protein
MSTDSRLTEVRSVQREPGREQRVFSFKATQLVWLFFGILEGLIALRILLKLIAANPNSPFAAMLYRFTDLFLFPFAGLTATPSAGGMVLELSSFIALIFYALIAWVVARLVWVIFYRPRGPIEQVTQTTSSEERIPRP